MFVLDSAFWFWLLLGLVVLLVIVIWSIRRHRSPILHVQCESTIDKLMPSLSGLSLSTAVDGNTVEVLQNGAFFDVLEERIRAAQHSVHFETFLWKPGALGTRLATALMERARAGVVVRLMLDAQGSKTIEADTVERMREAGCKVKFFHKRSIYTIGVLNDRDHRKMVIIDGKEAFVGGHCVVDDWLGDAEDKLHFSDVSVWLHGPVVHSIQGAFSENWTGETGEVFVGDEFYPVLEKVGDVSIFAAYVKPENSAPAVKLLHHTALCLAKKRIWIQNPYFIPKKEAIAALVNAVKRGVDVRVMMPATSGSDSPTVQHAGHYHFEQLLEGGVRLFEYPHTLLHQKIMTIDGCWSAVGSTNFDDRSFDTNDEISLGILDAGVAAQFDAVFERYVKRAPEVTLAKWKKRSLGVKFYAAAAYLIHDIL
ncbi:phospholipase D-like domain-containing protein [Ramlibacter sp. XY19]|uniref:phospholipase D-like domain-containing protein n=1 Tax=Ramlibacter paludis TaxID=2908000 RepID=UPI0023DC1D9F|nr:phospholipase D-like domain-containing protein [Ramlibacter paludis]MCG2595122.1 phospholipase D-like domain-containing protein [Ramlibacter paludis]